MVEKVWRGKSEGWRPLGTVGCGLDLSGLGQGQMVGCCEHGCELVGKFREFFD